MSQISKISKTVKATIATVIAISLALFGAAPAFAASFAPTTYETSVSGTQILVHTSVAIDAARSTGAPADFTLKINSVTRASSTYSISYAANDVVVNLTTGSIAYGDTVTLSYSAGGGRKIYKVGNNDTLANFSNKAVTNRVPVPDTTAPIFNAMTANSAGTNITITYNEPLLTTSVPAASAFVITQSGATISNTAYTVGVAGSTVTLTFGSPIITYNTSVFLTYTAPGTGAIKDLAGNAASSIAPNHVNNPVPDTTAPRITGRATNVAGDLITIYFDEPLSVSNVPAPADYFILVNSAAYPTSSLSIDVVDSQVNIRLLGSPIKFGDSIQISYTHNVLVAKQIQDVAHNIGNETSNEVVTNNTLDLGAPVLDGRETNIAGDQITVNYLSPLLTSSVPSASEYVLTIGGTAYTSFTTAISGYAVVLTLTGLPVPYGAVVMLSYSGSSVKKASNSVAAPTFSNAAIDNHVVPTAAPFAESGQTSVDGYNLYINLSKPLYESAVPLASDFLVEFDSSPYVGTYTVSVAGSVVTLHLSTPAAQGVYVEVGYTPGIDPSKRLKDLAGNEAASWVDLDITNRVPDTQAPTVVSRVTNTAGTQIIITFSEQLCETCLPLTTDLYLVFDGNRYDPANYTMSISGATYTFTLTGPPITYGQVLRLSYVPNTIVSKRVQDVVGNLLPATNNAVITNQVPTSGAPSVTSKSTNPDGTTITVAYDRTLDGGSIPAPSEFAVKVNGATYGGGFTVAIGGNSLVLTLTGAPIAAGSTVSLSYSGSSVKASVGGVAAATFTDNLVASFVRPELVTLATDNSDGRHIYLTYNVPLNEASIPTATDFTLTINGLVYSTANYSVSVTGSSVILDLQLSGVAIKQTDAVRLVYNPGATPIEDSSGNDAAALPLTIVSNRVPDAVAPENISLVTNLIGSQIIWTFNEPLDPNRVPRASDIVIAVDGLTLSNTAYTIGVDDSHMIVYLTGSRIRFGQIVVMAYAKGLIGNQLADPTGNTIDDEPHATVFNQVSSTAIPAISSMVTNSAGTQISLNYNKALDVTSVPLAGDFIVSLNDAIIPASNLTISISGNSVQIGLLSNTVGNGVRVDVVYAQGLNKIKDADGNYADSFEKTRVTNLVPDTTPPVIISRVTNAAGNVITVTVSEPLNTAFVHDSSDLVLMFDGVRYDPQNYTISLDDSKITITLTGPAIRFGQVLRLSYTRNVDPSKWTQDLAGNPLVESVNQSIDNNVPDTSVPTLVSATTAVLGDKITLTYNHTLSTTSIPSPSDFVLRVGGSTYSNARYTVAISGSTVVLTLTGSAVAHTEAVLLSYSGSTIKRLGTNIPATTLSNLTVVNLVPDATAPVILLRDQITIYLGNLTVTTANADDESTWSVASDESNYFAIDSNTGVITASAQTPLGTYSLTVTATNDAGLQTDATISIVVRPIPIVASNGGEQHASVALPPLATHKAPVTGVTTTIAETKVVASIETHLGLRVVSVLEPVGGVPSGATISIKPGPVEDESSDGRYTIEVNVTSPTGQDIDEFDKIFTLNLGRYIEGTIPAHSADGINWPALPLLKGDWLPAGAHDGYYIDELGNLIILTRHMTFFGLKKDQQMIHALRILTGPTRMVVGGTFNFKVQGGLGAGQVKVENLTPTLCSISAGAEVEALAAGTCVIRSTKLGDGVYADAISQETRLLIEDPSAKIRTYGTIKLLKVDLGPSYAGKTVSIMMSTPSVHPFTLYRMVTLDENGVKEIRAGFDSHATFRIVYGKKIVVNAKANN